MVILENDTMAHIPLDDPQELAVMINTFATDWAEVLAFFTRMARSRGLVFNPFEVEIEIRKLIGEEHAE